VSQNPKFTVGDIVMGLWRLDRIRALNGAGLRKLDPAAAPGVGRRSACSDAGNGTGYHGMLEIGQQSWENVVVAAASGAGRLGGRADRQDQGIAARSGSRAAGQVTLVASEIAF